MLGQLYLLIQVELSLILIYKDTIYASCSYYRHGLLLMAQMGAFLDISPLLNGTPAEVILTGIYLFNHTPSN